MAKTPAQRAAKHGEAAPGPRPAVDRSSLRPAAPRGEGNPAMLLIAGAAATVFLFFYVHLMTLQQMTDLSDGLAMPDSRLGGFDVGAIEALRAAMDADANGQLQFVHMTAGWLFPVVFAITAVATIAVTVPKSWLRWLLWLLPVLFAGVRIAANITIDGMLGADTLDAGAVTLASTLVVAGWWLLFASLAGVAVALLRGWRRLRVTPARAA